MFEVRLVCPFGDGWQERDEVIYRAAGRTSEWAGAGISGRDHGWNEDTFADARALKARLDALPGVTVTIREA